MTRYYAGMLQEFGMKPTLVEVYLSIFFSSEPMGLSDISGETGYSKSTVCKMMDVLTKYTDIRRFKKPGSKKIYYECAHDIKQAVRRKMGSQRQLITGLIRILNESEEKLAQDQGAEAERIKTDLMRLRKDYERVDKMLGVLMAMKIIGGDDGEKKEDL